MLSGGRESVEATPPEPPKKQWPPQRIIVTRPLPYSLADAVAQVLADELFVDEEKILRQANFTAKWGLSPVHA